MKTLKPKAWGLLPSDVRELVLKREWNKDAALKARLLGHKPFPLQIGLKPPDGKYAIADMTHFQRFIREWKNYKHQDFIQWVSRSYRKLSEQTIPKYFVLKSMENLIRFIGPKALQRNQIWTTNMAPLLQKNPETYPALVKHLRTIEQMKPPEPQLLANLIGQLSPHKGKGYYLRALPLVGVDTKFLENHQSLLTDILDLLHNKEVSNAGGLPHWLECQETPKDWLIVRPLCESVKGQTGGFSILQLPRDTLSQKELPARNILIVENRQSGLGLPPLPDTIAVLGGGQNVLWIASAHWLKTKKVGYWGDIDTWGLSILSLVRSKLSAVESVLGNPISFTPLMMDLDTLRLYSHRMVREPEPIENCPANLTPPEKEIFYNLKSGKFQGSRLEQERLAPDYILSKLEAWIKS